MGTDGALAPRPTDPTRIPPALLLALGGGLVATLAVSILRAYSYRHMFDDEGMLLTARYSLISHGLGVTIAALIVAGVAELRRRLPSAASGLLVAGAIGLLGVQIAELVHAYALVPGKDDFQEVLAGYRWLGRLDVTAAVAFAAGLCFLGEGSARVRALTVPFLAFAVLAHPPMMISDWLTQVLHDNPGSPRVWLAAVVFNVIRIGYAGLALAVIREALRDGPAAPAPTPWYVAAEGFFRVGSALSARIVIAVIAALFLMMGAGAKSIAMVKLWMFATPAALLLVGVLQVVAMLRAATISIGEAPRLRLYVGAAATTWALVVSSIQAFIAYQLTRNHDARLSREMVEVLTWASPVVALCGLLCFISAISALAAHLRGTVSPERATTAGIVVVVCTGAAVGLQQWVMDGMRSGALRSEGMFVVISLVVVTANIIALHTVAKLSQDLARDLHGASEAPATLPRAELRY